MHTGDKGLADFPFQPTAVFPSRIFLAYKINQKYQSLITFYFSTNIRLIISCVWNDSVDITKYVHSAV
jgi:hypothetical protein